MRPAAGARGADPLEEYKKADPSQKGNTHTIMPCRSVNTMHWTISPNWMDDGRLPTQVDNATIGQVATAFGINASEHSSVTAIGQADRVKIIEKIYMETETWATPTNTVPDNKNIINICQESCYTAEAIKEGRHQTMGALPVDFLWAEAPVRAQRADPTVRLRAVPNGQYAVLWNRIHQKPEDEKWDTKTSNSNAQQIGNIKGTWATSSFLAKKQHIDQIAPERPHPHRRQGR
jgi:hypothetical protein